MQPVIHTNLSQAHPQALVPYILLPTGPMLPSPSPATMTPLALLSTALAVAAAQNISPETNNEITNEELKNLNKPTGLDLK